MDQRWKVVAGSLLGATLIQALSVACNNAMSDSPPDAQAAEPACESWEVRSVSISREEDVVVAFPDGFEPFAQIGGVGADSVLMMGKRCAAP